jgi:phytoene synthase
MLDGQREDVQQRRYHSFEQLRHYCYRVASTVGLLCIEIWGYDDPAARELAVDRGIAFQLTNILRDYAQDFDAGRVYLPDEDFERARLTPRQLRNWSDPAACSALIWQQIDRAEMFYRRSALLDEMIRSSCRPTLWAMTTIYRGLLEKMKDNPSRLVLGGRLRLSAARKGTIAIRAKWLSKFGGTPASIQPAPVHLQRDATG